MLKSDEHFLYRLQQISACADAEALYELSAEIGAEEGFFAGAYMNLPPLDSELKYPPAIIRDIGYPEVVGKTYAKNEWYKIDPLLKRAVETGRPFLHSDLTDADWDSADLQKLRELIDEFVTGNAIGIPVFGPNNTRGFFVLIMPKSKSTMSPERRVRVQAYCQAAHLRYCQVTRVQRERCALTDREIETMKLVVQGLSTPKIAEAMGLSAHTINTNLRRVFEKLGVSDRVTAALKFLTLGYIYL